MVIRKVNHNTFDVFMFSGWSGWSRVRKGKTGSFCVNGNRLTKETLGALDKLLHSRFTPDHGEQFDIE